MSVDTPLPQSGVGFVTNNRVANGEFQFGQKSTIELTSRGFEERLTEKE
jgi:hypothetical protein